MSVTFEYVQGESISSTSPPPISLPFFPSCPFPALFSLSPFLYSLLLSGSLVFILQSCFCFIQYQLLNSFSYKFSHTCKGSMLESSLTALIEIIWSEGIISIPNPGCKNYLAHLRYHWSHLLSKHDYLHKIKPVKNSQSGPGRGSKSPTYLKSY